MQRVVTIAQVRSFESRNGNTGWVTKDSEGNEYTTFREAIGERVSQLEGKQARIECHEVRRGQYTNVYLDSVEPVADARSSGDCGSDPDEAAWQTAVAAAPWLVGESGTAVPPKKLYDKLKPFEEYVAADIEENRRTRGEENES
jgi:hypothetical protein